MSRTPSTSTAECEALLGPRGSLTVTSDNRGHVQKWLTTKGIPASVAKSCKLATLAKAYNDQSDRYLGGMVRNLSAFPNAAGETPAQFALNQEAPTMNTPATAPTTDRAATLAAAIAAMMQDQDAAPLDEGRVIALIQEHAPREGRPQAITLTINDTARNLPADTRHAIFQDALTILATRSNLFLVGPAGSGKTTLAEQIAAALDLPFYFNGAIDSSYKLSGFIDAQGRCINTAFRRAYETGGVYLFDEVDASLPGALLAFNAALANGYCDFPDGMVKRHANFYCIAAANTFGTGADRQYVGRNQLDAASLDRFAFLDMPYDEALERAIAGNPDWTSYVQNTRRAVSALKIRHVVSPRASIMGAKLLATGMDRAKVEQITIWKGLDKADVEKIRAN